LGINRTWRSRWFARKDYGALLHEDLNLKAMLKKKFAHAGISRIEVERAANKLTVIIFTSRPGIIVGKKGTEIEKLKKDLQTLTGREINLRIQEINKPELDAQLVGEGIAQQLEKRIAFRRAMRRARQHAAFRGQGNQGAGWRTIERRGNRAVGVVPSRAAPPAHFARRHRLRFRAGVHDLRRHWRQGVDLQRRSL